MVGLAGDVCLKVVERERGGTTAKEFHCSGSCPTCNAFVAKCGSFSRYPVILILSTLEHSYCERE